MVFDHLHLHLVNMRLGCPHQDPIASRSHSSLQAGRSPQNSCEVALLSEWLYAAVRRICVYTWVECGHNGSPTTIRSGLPNRITICPLSLIIFTTVLLWW